MAQAGDDDPTEPNPGAPEGAEQPNPVPPEGAEQLEVTEEDLIGMYMRTLAAHVVGAGMDPEEPRILALIGETAREQVQVFDQEVTPSLTGDAAAERRVIRLMIREEGRPETEWQFPALKQIELAPEIGRELELKPSGLAVGSLFVMAFCTQPALRLSLRLHGYVFRLDQSDAMSLLNPSKSQSRIIKLVH